MPNESTKHYLLAVKTLQKAVRLKSDSQERQDLLDSYERHMRIACALHEGRLTMI